MARPQDWPGVHCVLALLEGTSLEGTWFDRTAEYSARRRGEEGRPDDYAEPESIELTQLPCWSQFAPSAYRARVGELVQGIVDRRRLEGAKQVLGRRAILRQHPHEKPVTCDRSPAPAVHAATKAVRLMLRVAYWQFVHAFREAADRLRRGDRAARFPPGAFPPPLPCCVPSG